MPVLILMDDNESVYELESETCIIGRKEYCDIFIDDKQISKHHARILKDAGHYAIEDLESRNGTFINGKRIKRAILRDGDRIILAETLLVYHKDEMHRTSKKIRRDLR
jgi:pSer/pThr/pTyr-binding forkhead associated (FHA) protein